jgi:hypothetical protein
MYSSFSRLELYKFDMEPLPLKYWQILRLSLEVKYSKGKVQRRHLLTDLTIYNLSPTERKVPTVLSSFRPYSTFYCFVLTSTVVPIACL